MGTNDEINIKPITGLLIICTQLECYPDRSNDAGKIIPKPLPNVLSWLYKLPLRKLIYEIHHNTELN